MFFELPEILRCPHCGPEHPLVLLVRESSDRRVLGGWLGCPNCGRDFPVSAGVADLRLEPDRPRPVRPPYTTDELAVKIGALTGIAEGGGYLLLGARLAHVADEIAELLPDVEVVALDETPGGSAEREGVSRVRADAAAPIAPLGVRAAAVAGEPGELMRGFARAVATGGHMVLFDAGSADLDLLGEEGYEILAREEDIAVARRSGLGR